MLLVFYYFLFFRYSNNNDNNNNNNDFFLLKKKKSIYLIYVEFCPLKQFIVSTSKLFTIHKLRLCRSACSFRALIRISSETRARITGQNVYNNVIIIIIDQLYRLANSVLHLSTHIFFCFLFEK